VAHALAWMSGAKWTAQLVSWAAFVIVARLLTPDDFGLVGMAQIFIALVTIFSEFGLATAIIAHPDLTEEQVAQLNAVAVLVGIAALLIGWAAAPTLGHFFRSSELPAVMVALSSVFAISAFRTVPNALLQRELRFPYLAVTESAQAVLVAGITTLLAVLGFGYWTLVVGAVGASVIGTAMAVYGRPCRLARPRLGALRSILVVGTHLLVGRLAFWVQTNVDSMLIGRLLGRGPLGTYAMAMSLASLPLDKLTVLLSQVSSPFLAAAQDDRPAVRRLILVLTGVVAIVVFPITAGMALVADVAVPAALGPKWGEVIRPLQLLAVWAGVRSLAAVLAPVVVITGGVQVFMYFGLVEAVVMSVAFYAGSGFGIVGIAAAWLLVYPIMRLPLWVWVLGRTGIRPGAYLGAIQPAIQATVLMSLAVLGIKLLSPPEWAAAQHMIAQIAGGAVAYGAGTLARRQELLALYHDFRELGRPAPGGPRP
jgi:PST family polysaccharide transporter